MSKVEKSEKAPKKGWHFYLSLKRCVDSYSVSLATHTHTHPLSFHCPTPFKKQTKKNFNDFFYDGIQCLEVARLLQASPGPLVFSKLLR